MKATAFSKLGHHARPFLAVAICVALARFGAAQVIGQDKAIGLKQEELFEGRIRPVLVSKCVKCHGGEKESNGLRVDSRQRLIQGGDSGAAISPGKPEESLLIRAIRHEGDLQMPPDERLSAEIVKDFEAWIRAGALWPESVVPEKLEGSRHWAFAPVAAVEPPAAIEWSDHPIDRFVAAAWKDLGLSPVAQAERSVLLRRVYFDLIGLPPAPVEVDEYLADSSSAALKKVVERLLASPRYGERWGRYWMDVAHYADTAGDNADYPVPEARLYRDYIIDAFNADKPYDEFVREQIAGDLLAASGPREAYAQRVAATGFLALSRRYGTSPRELWHLTIEDAIDTLSQAVLGLTMRCARCHDHKFDPITTDDYYAIYGIFESTRFAYTGSEELKTKGWPRAGFVPLVPPDEAQPAMSRFAEKIAAAEKRIKEIQSEGPLAKELAALMERMNAQTKVAGSGAAEASVAAPLDATSVDDLKQQIDAMTAKQKRELDSLNAELTKIRRPGRPAELAAAYGVSEGEPADVSIQQRGEPGQPGRVVSRGVPAFLQPAAGTIEIPAGSSGRLPLAQWLTRPKNPLTARVMVNRIWQHHFGVGLVATPSNFGLRGSPPSHPELLDWLSTEFIKSGWSIKAMHRLILSSKTWQLASTSSEAAAKIDPGNVWYWRYTRRRLDAEAIRDAMLAVGGRLDDNRPGEHPFPPIDTWNWTQHAPFKQVYDSNHRSVYLMTQRIARHPYLALFDGPDTNHSTETRTSSTVPLQALYLMNNPFVLAQASGLASRMLAADQDETSRIDFAWRLAWGRQPAPMEVEKAQQFLRQAESELASTGVAEAERSHEAWTSLAKILLTANEFLYVD